LEQQFCRFEARLAKAMDQPADALQYRRQVECRYQGQSSALRLPWQRHPADIEKAFHARHQAQYGHALDAPVELVNLRARAARPANPIELPVCAAQRPGQPVDSVQTLDEGRAPVYSRDALAPGQHLEGPAIVTEAVATTWLARHWTAEMTPKGHLWLTRTKKAGTRPASGNGENSAI